MRTQTAKCSWPQPAHTRHCSTSKHHTAPHAAPHHTPRHSETDLTTMSASHLHLGRPGTRVAAAGCSRVLGLHRHTVTATGARCFGTSTDARTTHSTATRTCHSRHATPRQLNCSSAVYTFERVNMALKCAAHRGMLRNSHASPGPGPGTAQHGVGFTQAQHGYTFAGVNTTLHSARQHTRRD